MGLNKSKGNMYEFVTHTWNTVKGACPHDCSYCYMKKWGELKPARFDETELKTDLGSGNFIFVGSSNDMFAASYPDDWIIKTLNHCHRFDGNRYLFQTKNPERMFQAMLPANSIVCTTIETNRLYPEIIGSAPTPTNRGIAVSGIENTFVTIEPVMDFDKVEMLTLVSITNPVQVNIGANTGKAKLPEPSKEKLIWLIEGLQDFTKVVLKKNLNRLLI